MRTTTAELERLRKARERDRKTIARLRQLVAELTPKPGMLVPYFPPEPPRRWRQFWR